MWSREELVECLRRRDHAVQVQLYETYHDPLYRILLTIMPLITIHQLDCVENGIVAAFMELFERPELFDPTRSHSRDPLLALLVGMARPRTIDCLRSLRKDLLTHIPPRRSEDPQAVSPEAEDSHASGGESAAASLRDAALAEALEALLDGEIDANEYYRRVLIHIDIRVLDDRLEKLKPRQFVVYFLKHAVKLPVREIARLLILTEDAVENILKRARAMLQTGRENQTGPLPEDESPVGP